MHCTIKGKSLMDAIFYVDGTYPFAINTITFFCETDGYNTSFLTTQACF